MIFQNFTQQTSFGSIKSLALFVLTGRFPMPVANAVQSRKAIALS